MTIKPHILPSVFLFLLACVFTSYAQGGNQTLSFGDTLESTRLYIPPLPPDSITDRKDRNVDMFYDSIKSRADKRKFSQLLYDIFILEKKEEDDENEGVRDEASDIKRYEGRAIGSITINRKDVFDPAHSWLQKVTNNTHALTWESTIRRDLLFKIGDELDPEMIVINNQILRSRSYIYESYIEVIPNPMDSTIVDIVVNTQDSWTISVDAGRTRDKRLMVNLYDANFLGSGDRMGVKTNFTYGNWGYGGNILEYSIPNLWGTFYNAYFNAGRDFGSTVLEAGLNKHFIQSQDYGFGIDFSKDKTDWYKYLKPENYEHVKVQSRDFKLWTGKSFYIPKINSSIYITGSYSFSKFIDRLDVGPKLNAGFHNYDRVLAAVGLYREKFYSSTLIYGYGFREYVPAGYKVELVGGYSWEEFGRKNYAGISAAIGEFTKIGFLSGGFSAGSYINRSDRTLWRSAIDANLNWFSNLSAKRRTRIRQFIKLNYTQGWNMGDGEGALVELNKEHMPQSFNKYASGLNRMILNTETVIFTPYEPLGFRVAIFTFADAGLIGMNNNMFRNDFFGTFGVGIRLKNERLIFNAIQIRLGFAVGKHGFIKNQMFQFTSEQRISQYMFIPRGPEPVLYK